MRIENGQISFTSCSRVYKAADVFAPKIFSQEEIYTTSHPFRGHIDWKKLINYILYNFEGKKRINIFSLGCADGSESISYALGIARFGSCAQLGKVLPIYACDIDPKVINIAQSGKINLNSNDFSNIAKTLGFTNIDEFQCFISKYLKKTGSALKLQNDSYQSQEFNSVYDPICSYKLTGKLKDAIKFYESDILTEVNNIIDDGNSVVNTCHVLGYCDDLYVEKVLQALSEKLKTGSLYVYDKMHANPVFENKLRNLGFFKPFEDMCFMQKK